ncbi:hypothetical protein LEP1GSC083_3236 [Leptospira interrogans serovar Pyrogenes str. L0374]|uniref:Uncharacterized protein n=1 Tax=Leptospira interrogans serovar Pyrogenes str. L0374 TaxID=1049928 RepID=M6KYT6_LEPIR|nr:hypothetical protein LEP1GSC083_3236 [Leptospira interrogans serovar Pyrogenes str. L0374]
MGNNKDSTKIQSNNSRKTAANKNLPEPSARFRSFFLEYKFSSKEKISFCRIVESGGFESSE